MSDWHQSNVKGLHLASIAFSPGNKYVIACSNSDCILFAAEKGERLAFAEHSDTLSGAFFVSENEFACVTSGGEVVVWKFEGKHMEQVKSARVTAYSVRHVLHLNHPISRAFLVVEGNTCTLSSLSLNDMSLEVVGQLPRELPRKSIAVADNFYAFCEGKKVTVRSLDAEKKIEGTFENMMNLRDISKDINDANVFCAVSAYGNTLAAAISVGRVYVWNNVMPSAKLGATQSVHWHNSPPSIALSPFGGIFSAGGESVLCKFPLSRAAKPSFLPRLHSPIVDIFLSPDAGMVALLHDDNSLIIVQSASMTVLTTCQGVQRSKNSLNAVWAVDPAFPKYIVASSRPGWLQWIDASTGITKNNCHVALENSSSTNAFTDSSDLNFFDIADIVIGRHAVCTLEKRINWDQDTQRIRFWSRNISNPWELRLQESYQVGSDVIGVRGCTAAVSDSDKVFITMTDGGKFAVYEPWADGTHWRRDAVREASWQDAKLHASSSILPGGLWVTAHAGAKGDSLVLWDVTTMRVIEVVSADGPVSHLEWANSSIFLFVTDKSVSAFDISSLTLRWKVDQSLPVNCSPNGSFAVQKDQVIRFDAGSGKVVDTLKMKAVVKDVKLCKNSQWKDTSFSCIIARTEKNDDVLCATCLRDDRAAHLTDETRVLKPSASHETPFSRLTSEGVTRDADINYRAQRVKLAQPAKVLDAPAHALPPLTHIAPLFISSCLLPPAK